MTTVTPSPVAIDDATLSLQALRDVKLWSSKTSEQFKSTTNIIAVASNFDRIFVGGPECLVCVSASLLESLDEQSDVRSRRHALEDENVSKIVVALPSTPNHLALSADELTLAVSCFSESGSVVVYMFDTRAFADNDDAIQPFTKLEPLNPPGVLVHQLSWNPVLNSMLAVVYSNGGMALIMINNERPNAQPDCVTLPPAEGILCVCWSPKGKQLVAGRKGGLLTQYKPDLKEAKTIPAPTLPESTTMDAKSILWISTYQFLVLYLVEKGNVKQPSLIVANSSKTGETKYVTYEDICYCNGHLETPQYYLNTIPDWGLTFCASDDAIESTALQCNGTEWTQLMFESSGPALLPRDTVANVDRYPAGMALFMGSSRRLKDAENRELNPCPVLFLVAVDGMLRGYYVLNKKNNAPVVTKTTAALSKEGIRKGVIPLPTRSLSGLTTPSRDEKAHQVASSEIEQESISEPPKFAPEKSYGDQPKMLSLKSGVTDEVDNEEVKEVSNKPPEATSVDNSHVIISVINTELNAFQQEIENFKTKASHLCLDIGTEDEKRQLKVLGDNMNNECRSLTELTSTQSEEVENLQTLTLELHGWISEAKSRQLRDGDSRNRILSKARSLDPISQRTLQRLDATVAQMEQQVFELNKMLDIQWKDISQGIKDKPHTTTSIQEALLLNHKIANIQRRQVNKLVQDLLALRKGQHGRDISALMESLIVESEDVADLSRRFGPKLQLHSSTSSRPADSPIKALTSEKGNALKEYLFNRGTVYVKSTTERKNKPTTAPDTTELKKNTERPNSSSSSAMLSKLMEKDKQERAECKGEGIESVARKLTFAAASKSTKAVSTATPTTPSFSKLTTSVKPPMTTSKDTKTTSEGISSIISSDSMKNASLFASGSPATSLPFAPTAKPTITQRITFPSTTADGLTKTAFSPVTNGSKSAMTIPKPLATSVTKTQASEQPLKEDVKPAMQSPKVENRVTVPQPSNNNTSPLALALSTKPTTGILQSQIATVNKTSDVVKSSIAVSSSSSTEGLFGALALGASATPGNVFGVSKPSVATTTIAASSSQAGKNEIQGLSVFGNNQNSILKSVTTTANSSPSPTTGGLGVLSNPSTTTQATIPFTNIKPIAQNSSSIFASVEEKANSIKQDSPFSSQTVTTTGSSIFGKMTAPSSPFSTPTTVATTPTLGSTPTTTSTSLFDTSTKSSPFTTPTTTVATGSSVTAAPVANTKASAGSASPFATPPPSGGREPISSVSSGSPFATPPTSGTSSPAPFSSPTTTTSTTTASSPLFGSGVAATVSSPFGAPTTSTATTSSSTLFGTQALATTSASAFVSSSASPFASSSSPFGSTPTATSPFGTGSSSGGIFGGTSTLASASPFSSTTTTTATSSTNAFGVTTSTSSSFGAPNSGLFNKSSSSSIFGSPSTPSTTVVAPFGSASNSTGNIFGGGNNSSGSTNVFGGPPSPSVFGSPSTASTATPAFGGGTNVFGSPANSNSSASNVFGNTNQTTTSSPFGAAASGATAFGAASPAGFGGSPSFGNTPKPLFGGGATFGGSPTFGGGATFGGSPSFGGGSVPSPATNNSAFGGSATFGALAQQQGGPSFGSLAAQSGGASSTFGSAPTFGSGSTFGSNSATFGSGSTLGSGTTFGSSSNTGGNSLFGGGSSAPSPPPQSSSFTTWR